jgi:hypothetical protein
MSDPMSPAVIKVVTEAMRAYDYAPASEPKLTSPSEILEAIKGLNVGKAPDPNSAPNRALRHLLRRAITFLTKFLTLSSEGSSFHQPGNTLAWYPF